jgi:hypothetical protein
VLALRLRDGEGWKTLAIAAGFLQRHPVYDTELAGRRLVVVTSRRGANRVYDAGAARFVRLAGPERIVDDGGQGWKVTEAALEPEGAGEPRPRVTAHRAFWFGWYAQFPETGLIR